MNYYNENDPKAAQWLRDLIWAGAISDGEVDTRSIEDVTPNDLSGYKQCHFFAGIGGWSLALRLAGWPDDQPVWTGSCPCQPFSAAGEGGGFDDERHLWPALYHLIETQRPPVVFGEQVASPDGLAWLDLVQADLEAEDYAVGAVDLCAAGVGAPHIRQRLYWLGVANSGGRSAGLAAAATNRHGRSAEPASGTGDVGNPHHHQRSQGWGQRRHGTDKWPTWEASLVDCRDGKRRPVEPRAQPMVDGLPESLELVRSLSYARIEAEIARAAISETDTREALRNLWVQLAAETIQRPAGGLHGVREASVLLAVMRQLAREGWQLLNHLPSSCWQSPQAGMREMLSAASPFARTPQGREPGEQRAGKPANPLSVVSQAVAHEAEMCIIAAHPLTHNYPGRVGMLRGYGNAIVPQVAAEFIGAYLDTI